jgi:hypothetical protein
MILCSSALWCGYPSYPHALQTLSFCSIGHLNGRHALKAFLVEAMKAMLGQNRRQLSNTTKHFYTTLLQQGGPMLHNWVSDFFAGPALSTTRLFRSSAGLPDSLGLTPEHLDFAVDVLKRWDLLGAPCLLSEDGTALQIRLDAVLRGQQIVLFGINGGSVVISSLQQLKEVVKERKVASILYAYCIVPLVRGAPYIPLFLFCHDQTNATFNPTRVLQVWQYLWQVKRSPTAPLVVHVHALTWFCSMSLQALVSRGVKLVGHVSDGDPRMRLADLLLTWK